MIYRCADGRTQEVGAWEGVRRRLLERMGWAADGQEQDAGGGATGGGTENGGTENGGAVSSGAAQGGPAGVTPLPDDFPWAAHLRRSGLLTVEDVRAEPDLTGIPHIGAARAAKIRAHPLIAGAGGGGEGPCAR